MYLHITENAFKLFFVADQLKLLLNLGQDSGSWARYISDLT